MLHPIHQRLDAIGANVAVVAIELCRARHAETVYAQSAGDQFGFVVKQAHIGRTGLALRIVEVDGDGVALHRVNVHSVAQLRCEISAGYTGTHHPGVEDVHAGLCVALCHGHHCLCVVTLHMGDILVVQNAHAQTLCGICQAVGELVYVTG